MPQKSHTKKTIAPVVKDYRSVFLGNRPIESVKRWAAVWYSGPKKFCLIGPCDWVCDLLAALEKCMNEDDSHVTFIFPEPCVQGTGFGIYGLAKQTIIYFKDQANRDFWNNELMPYGGYIPDNWSLTELNMKGKRK